MEFDPLVLNWFFQKYEDENPEHIKLFTETKIDSKKNIFCHPNYRGNGPWNDYVMIKYTINQAGTPTTKLFPVKLVAMFAEPTENVNATSLHPTHVLVQDVVFPKTNTESIEKSVIFTLHTWS